LRENRAAEETANGRAGVSNPYGRYFNGLGTLNEQLIREEKAPVRKRAGASGESENSEGHPSGTLRKFA
jgi:hypothetical protein